MLLPVLAALLLSGLQDAVSAPSMSGHSVLDALEALLRSQSRDYAISGEALYIANLHIVRQDDPSADLAGRLDRFVHAENPGPPLFWRVEDHVVHILSTEPIVRAPVQPAGAPPIPPAQWSISLVDAPLRTALDELFRGTRLSFAYATPATPGNVTLAIEGRPFEFCLRYVVRSAIGSVSWQRFSGIYVLQSDPKIQAQSSTRTRLLTMRLRQVELADAMRVVALLLGVRIEVDPSARALVTLDLHDVPARTAIETILRCGRRLSYLVEDGVYKIRVRAPEDHGGDGRSSWR